MGMIVRRVLFCDDPNCDVQIESLGGKSAEHIRDDARSDGWSCRRSGDLCPDCARAKETPSNPPHPNT